jgi:hypothetical protein
VLNKSTLKTQYYFTFIFSYITEKLIKPYKWKICNAVVVQQYAFTVERQYEQHTDKLPGLHVTILQCTNTAFKGLYVEKIMCKYVNSHSNI